MKKKVAISSRIRMLPVLSLLIFSVVPALAQRELLPLDHPATRTLVRLYEYGAIPEFQREHLPVSRGLAFGLLEEAAADTNLPSGLRAQAEYYRVELSAVLGLTPTRVVIPTMPGDRWLPDNLDTNLPAAGLRYTSSPADLTVVLEPVLDGELRLDPADSRVSMIFQGGVQLRGTIAEHVGFASRITNGSIMGDTTLPLQDPRLKKSGKFGVIGAGRDIDFGSAHIRLDYDHVAIDIAREATTLGGGNDRSLLIGSQLPSNFDWLRISAQVGKVAFTHLHGSLLPDLGARFVGSQAQIPAKYIATHLLSVGPFAGIRVSLGESLLYSSRQIELGYINPLNFLKSQEHYLRDRDNSNMYGAISVNPVPGVFLEGEYLLDDLRFSQIGNGFWGNKSAYRLGGKVLGVLTDMIDVGFTFTHLEPYVYTHFNDTNAYTHDGAMLAGGGLEPNSYAVDGFVTLIPLPNLRVSLMMTSGRHGANVTGPDSTGAVVLVRNVGGDVEQTLDYTRDSPTVTFLDGTLEDFLRSRIELEYEPVRNIYLRGIYIRDAAKRADAAETVSTQIWFGIRVGAF